MTYARSPDSGEAKDYPGVSSSTEAYDDEVRDVDEEYDSEVVHKARA